MDENDANTLKILVATDIHLGYNENHPIRGDDSFNTFEEILKHAKNLNADFILLGGDLFHDTRPTTYCLDRCITLLKRYCLGDREIDISYLSDQSLNFKHCRNPQVNYEDPNYNIAIPVFSIHGNHDDPTGANKLSALDLLADIGLVNYFGKWTDLTHIDVHPLIIGKADTKLALFGLSHIRDERLSRLFKNNEVEIMRLQDDNVFNLLVLHQNRANRGVKNFIPEESIPNFVDLVIWGHEHDCRITPEIAETGISISQPGSSVATSLAEGESLQKHIGLLLINGTNFEMKNVVLKTVRPFVFKHYDHKTSSDNDCEIVESEDSTKKLVKEIVEAMIEDSKNLLHPDEPKQPTLPLIRLVFTIYNEKHQFNAIRVGQQFIGKVANPEDMILVKRLNKHRQGRSVYQDEMDNPENIINEGLFSEQIDRLLKIYMNDNMNKEKLQVLSLKGLTEATTRFLENNDDNAFEDVVKYYSAQTKKELAEKEFDEDLFDMVMMEINEKRNDEDVATEVQQIFNDPSRKVATANNDANDSFDIQSDDENNQSDDSAVVQVNKTKTSNTSSRGEPSVRRPARGRGSRGPRAARGRGRGKAKTIDDFY